MYRKTKSIFVVFAAAIVISLAFTGPVTAKESGQTELITSNSLSGKSILPSGEGKRRLLESVNKVLLNLKERLNKYENKIGKEKTEKIKSLLDELQEILIEIDNKGIEIIPVKEKLTQILYQLKDICKESIPRGKTSSGKEIEADEITKVESRSTQALTKELTDVSLLNRLIGIVIGIIAALLTIATWPVSGVIWALIFAIWNCGWLITLAKLARVPLPPGSLIGTAIISLIIGFICAPVIAFAAGMILWDQLWLEDNG